MSGDFPIGAAIEGTDLVITERVRGQPARGLYRASRPEQAGDGSYLVTITNPQTQPLDQVRAYLGFILEGAARFCAVAPVDGGEGGYHALIEEEPSGRPSAELGVLARAEAIRLALDVAEVLGYAHKARWVLAYLRPELIYVEDGRFSGLVPRPELFVLGAAAHSSGMGPLFDDIYSAPEVLALSNNITPAADVFSLCACLGRWLTGEHPFAGETVQAQMMAIMSGQGRPWRGPEDLGLVISDGLQQDPHKRISLDRLVELLEQADSVS